MKLFTIIISHVFFNFIKCQPHKLYEHINQQYPFFSTVTAYNYVSPVTPYPEPDCKVLQIWMMSRHGTRNPKKYDVTDILRLNEYKHINENSSSMKKEDIDGINSWEYNMPANEEAMLNNQGIQDMKFMGIKLRTFYTEIFKKGYNPDDFLVISSPEKRCLDSASVFLNHAFDTDVDRNNIEEMQIEDNRFNLYNRVNETQTEYEKAFLNSPEVKELIGSVTKRMGLGNSLEFKTVKSMYQACRYQKARNINFNSTWCAVFSERDLEILEYYNDLKYYYSHGYGYQKTELLSKDIIADLVKHFRDEASKKGVFYFGHSSNVFSVIVGLGLARDATPLTDSTFEHMHDRKWRTSYLDPFSANVRAVLYQCADELKVTFFINDAPMYVEKHDCTLCPWILIEKMLDPSSN